jgi:polysaccharide export outer membrane protein
MQVYDYAFVDINPIVLDCLVDSETGSFSKTFGGPAPALRVGVGDVLEATIFESSAGGLFTPAGAGNRMGNFVTVPRQTVSNSGTVTVPYAGVLQVAGQTVPEIERQIESKLASRAIEPQVVLTMVEQNAGTVAVVGDALSVSNTIKLSSSGERILDLVSKVGGLKFPPYDAFVTLQRKNRSATVHFPTLVAHPEENVFVRPGDLVYVYRDQRKYVAAGAIGASTGGASIAGNQTLVGAVGLFSFDQEHLSLNEAIAKAGGLLDDRADPAQVFLYRIERRKVLERMGVDLSGFAPNQEMIPTVYRANFRDPSSFLYAQRFPMRNKDTIYVGNAQANEFTKFLVYVNAVTGTMSGVAADANVVLHHGP